MTSVIFTKRKHYMKKVCNPGDIVSMPHKFAVAYIRSGSAKLAPKRPKVDENIPELINLSQGIQVTPDDVFKEKPMGVDDDAVNPGLVIETEEVPETEEESFEEFEETDVPEDAPINYEGMSYRELQKLAREKGLPITGKKEDLISRLRGED